MIGDLIGKPGRHAIEQILPGLRKARGIDFVTTNGENVAGGMGLTPSLADAILAATNKTRDRLVYTRHDTEEPRKRGDVGMSAMR